MLHAPPTVERAFVALLAALDAEIAELRAAGTQRFHGDAAPREAQGLLRRATEWAQLRENIAKLFAEWREGTPPAVAASQTESEEPADGPPILIRHIKGMSVPDAAVRLHKNEEKVREWLETGLLKGYRPTGGRWKITPADLMAFARDHRDLL